MEKWAKSLLHRSGNRNKIFHEKCKQAGGILHFQQPGLICRKGEHMVHIFKRRADILEFTEEGSIKNCSTNFTSKIKIPNFHGNKLHIQRARVEKGSLLLFFLLFQINSFRERELPERKSIRNYFEPKYHWFCSLANQKATPDCEHDGHKFNRKHELTH